MANNSTTAKAFRHHEKPSKPYPEFPLFAHASGQWARKIAGKMYYFGKWADPDGALELHDREYPYLKRKEEVPIAGMRGGCTLELLGQQFLESKEKKVNSGDFSGLTWKGYLSTIKRLNKQFGRKQLVEEITQKSWAGYRSVLAKHFAPTTMSVEITKIRAIFNWGRKAELHKEVMFGPDFERASTKSLRKHKREGGEKLFSREEIHQILEVCDKQLRAIVLLGVNCGFANVDIAELPESALDLKTGWVNFSRVKTEISRRIALWPETIQALEDWLPCRPEPANPEAKGKVFLTSKGTIWVRGGDNVLTPRFRRLLKRLNINGRRGLGYYALRHNHATIGGEAKDPDAVKATMGHSDGSMTANYQHRISDERLRAVTDVIRLWLFGDSLAEESD